MFVFSRVDYYVRIHLLIDTRKQGLETYTLMQGHRLVNEGFVYNHIHDV